MDSLQEPMYCRDAHLGQLSIDTDLQCWTLAWHQILTPTRTLGFSHLNGFEKQAFSPKPVRISCRMLKLQGQRRDLAVNGELLGGQDSLQLCPICPIPSEDSAVAEQLSCDLTWLPFLRQAVIVNFLYFQGKIFQTPSHVTF